jgi:molybdopterin-containing oxidoreductase family iron-sulfur binding subunit
VAIKGTIPAAPAAAGAAAGTVDVAFRPDPTVYDGRFTNNAWLQELPKPLTKLTWDNAALMSPATAERLGLRGMRPTDDAPSRVTVIELRQGGRTIKAPMWISPGHAPDTITLHLGYGRTRVGHTGNGIGFDANALRSSSAPDVLSGVTVSVTSDRHDLACTQDHWSFEGRNIIRASTTEEFAKDPDFATKAEHQPLSRTLTLYPNRTWEGYQWGMTIDQNVCTGCNSCVVACQAENNVPVVGKSQVMNGREMHWLRLDRYYSGSFDNPDTYHQPMPCQQCETAPCEVVCPVGATTHSDDGLNDMVYNRCVGTRYCSNNCPYKVRRFNFLLYSDFETSSLKLMRNPDVTVRSRGVMEKCTYCVQRIRQAEIAAKGEDRPIRDGDIVTACQAACPTEAIVFGNINDPESRVSKQKASKLNYGLLAELNTRPRTTYAAVVWNPNTELDAKKIEPEKEG